MIQLTAWMHINVEGTCQLTDSLCLLVNFEKSLLEVKAEIESCLHCININAEHYILKTILS